MSSKDIISPENTAPIQTGRFQKGQSGNPAGKPKGARHKATQLAQELLDGEVEKLIRMAIELALSGDLTALKICLDRLIPPLKSSAAPIQTDITDETDKTMTSKAVQLINAAMQGDVPPDIAAQLVSAIAAAARVEETESLKHRLEALEASMKGRKK